MAARTRPIVKRIRDFISNQDGNIGILAGITVPAVLLAAGLSVDTTSWRKQESRMQNVADGAALAAAWEVMKDKNAAVLQLARSVAKANGFAQDGSRTVSATYDPARGIVSVDLQAPGEQYFSAAVMGAPSIGVHAAAKVIKGASACLHVLEPERNNALEVDDNVPVTLVNCALVVNSTDPEATDIRLGGSITSTGNCPGGGYRGTPSQFTPPPEEKCGALDDPFKNIAMPASVSCDEDGFEVRSEMVTLSPKTYCDGIRIEDSDVTFAPGTYIISGGVLEIGPVSTVQGSGVTFILVNGAQFRFEQDSYAELSAPKTGPYAGFLFVESGANPERQWNEFKDRAVARLEGTIYLPQGEFRAYQDTDVKISGADAALVSRIARTWDRAKLTIDRTEAMPNSQYGLAALPGAVRLVE